ncbi:MAG: T9SS type A sorting domain-containing protein [Ekhidna sp.]
MRRLLKSIFSIGFSVVIITSAVGQFTGQAYSTGVAGGTASSASYTTEFSTGAFGGDSSNEQVGILLGLSSFNLESGVVTVLSSSEGTTISDDVEGLLLRIENEGNYDTLDIVVSSSGNFSFNPVFTGDFLVSVDSDPDKYVATYYGDAIVWDQADVLTLEGDSSIQIEVEAAPDDRDETTGQGSVSGTVTEDFEDTEGRIDARRRAAKRKCGLRRKRTGGRTGEDDGFELIAYGETNDIGEFEYGFLPEGTYRFFVEYPGIPLDEASFVEFEIGEAGVSDDTFVIAAVVTEEGIVVELILGLTSEFFTDFQIYPNPTTNFINISYYEIKSKTLSLEVVDVNGKTLLTRDDLLNENRNIQIDLSSYKAGQYLLRFIDSKSPSKGALTFRVIKK